MAVKKKNPNHPFKFKNLKVYGSAEWLAGKQKKYRRVFDRGESSYIYAELSFYNKLFDEKDWEINVTLKAFAHKGGKKIELCSLHVNRPVNKDENIIYIREGWGNKKNGIYWKKGVYTWEAYISDELVATTQFFVEDVGTVTEENNPYFDIESIKLYESSDDGGKEEERVYYTKFDHRETRFIFVEFKFKNKILPRPWNCEVSFKFYNDAHQLKGETIELKSIKKNDNTFTICTGWGSENKGTWFTDRYSLEIVFMDQLLAVIPFEVGKTFEEGITEAFLPDSGTKVISKKSSKDDASLEELLEELEGLVGLQTIKQKVRDYAEYLKFLKIRIDKGLEKGNNIDLHSVFTGNPGTGKTTVALLLGKIYHKMGLLSDGHIHEVDRSDLVGEYIGQTAPKVKEAIKKAKGGVMFIDEAYSLARSAEDNKDFGREVIEILVKEMSNGEGDLAVIMAGYPKEMQTLLDTNPGLKSRLNMWFEFPDYMPQELAEIAKHAADAKQVKISEEAGNYLYEKIVEAYRNRDRYFGNGRYINKLIDQGKMNLGLRIMKTESPDQLSEDDLSVLMKEDFQAIFKEKDKRKPDIPVDEGLLKSSLAELNELVGLDDIKKEIQELVNLVRFYKETGKEVLNNLTFHTVFTGNPGTGKTTVARILSRILKALGILERGHLVECDRQSLVAGFVGQTAIKTSSRMDDAMGGVMFIDEAYALSQRGQGDFGHESIETILKRMEDQKGEFAVVVAGYPDKMKAFLESNPGFKSRFDQVYDFKDFTAEELLTICKNLAEKEEYTFDKASLKHMKGYFEYMLETKDEFFGNGRMVRNTVKEIIKNQNLRLASLDKDKRGKKISQIILADVKSFNEEKARQVNTRNTIGFRAGGGSSPAEQ